MSKQHELSEHEYKIYQKIHGYEHSAETEQEKIHKEKHTSARLRKQGKNRLQQRLQAMTHSPALPDPEAVEPDPLNDDLEYMAERVIRNARTHKKRLKGIKRQEGDED